MTLPGPDLDLLADYLAGALNEAHQQLVRRQVTDHPDWATALRALQAAQEPVRQLLAAVPAPPMPPAVAARLDQVVRMAARGLPATTAVGPPDRFERSATAGGAVVVDLADRRRRRMRVLAIAAGVAVLAGASLAGVAGAIRSQHTATTAGAGQMDASKGNRTLPAAPQAGGAVGAQSPGLTLIASGRDYPTAADLTGAVAVGAPAPQLHTGQPRSSSSVPDSSGTIVANPSDVPAGLARLLDPQARASCLNLATAGDPGVVQLVDYARFASQPALVIVVREVTGHRVYAVGADCGQPGPGADFLAMTVAP